MIEAKFNPEMKSFLLQLQDHYTLYNIIEFKLLSTGYSQRLYELLKSWSSKNTFTIDIAQLHKILLTSDSAKKNFGEFRRSILEPAQKEIIKKTGIRFEWEAIKKGRSVSEILFVFGKKQAIPIAKAKATESQEKQSKRNNDLGLLAVKCWESKAHQCQQEDNKKSICKVCPLIR